jgi:integrase
VQFVIWCEEMGVSQFAAAHSPEAYDALLSSYVGWLATKKASPSTITVSLSAIKRYNLDDGSKITYSDDLKDYVRGHANIEGRAPKTQAQAAMVDDLRLMLDAFDFQRAKDVRDRALLLLGFIGGFRRSELAGIEIERVRYESRGKGIAIYIPKSKADQQGKGRTKVAFRTGTELCPVGAYEAWVKRAGITHGPVFLTCPQGRSGSCDQEDAGQGHRRHGPGPSRRRRPRRQRRRAMVRPLPAPRVRHRRASAGSIPRHQLMEDGGWSSNAIDGYYQAAKEFDDERAAARMGL